MASPAFYPSHVPEKERKKVPFGTVPEAFKCAQVPISSYCTCALPVSSKNAVTSADSVTQNSEHQEPLSWHQSASFQSVSLRLCTPRKACEEAEIGPRVMVRVQPIRDGFGRSFEPTLHELRRAFIRNFTIIVV